MKLFKQAKPVAFMLALALSSATLVNTAQADDRDDRRDRAEHCDHQKNKKGSRMDHGMMGRQGMINFRGLELTKTQREQMHDIKEEHHDSQKADRKALRDVHYRFMEALVDGTDDATLNMILNEKSDLMTQKQTAYVAMMQKQIAVLTDEQKAKLKERLQ